MRWRANGRSTARAVTPCGVDLVAGRRAFRLVRGRSARTNDATQLAPEDGGWQAEPPRLRSSELSCRAPTLSCRAALDVGSRRLPHRARSLARAARRKGTAERGWDDAGPPASSGRFDPPPPLIIMANRVWRDQGVDRAPLPRRQFLPPLRVGVRRRSGEGVAEQDAHPLHSNPNFDQK